MSAGPTPYSALVEATDDAIEAALEARRRADMSSLDFGRYGASPAYQYDSVLPREAPVGNIATQLPKPAWGPGSPVNQGSADKRQSRQWYGQQQDIFTKQPQEPQPSQAKQAGQNGIDALIKVLEEDSSLLDSQSGSTQLKIPSRIQRFDD